MVRFLVLALPLVLLALAGFHFGGEALDLPVPRLPTPFLLGLWILEAAGLVGLFLLVHERHLGRWVAGIASTWTAWIFRGPVLALSAAGLSAPGVGSWGTMVLAWLGLYTVCGLLMAAVAGSLGSGEKDPSPITTPRGTVPAGELSGPDRR